MVWPHKIKQLFLMLLLAPLFACGPGFEVLPEMQGDNHKVDDGNDPTPIDKGYSAYISGGPFDGMQVATFDSQARELYLLIPLGMSVAVEPQKYPVASLPGVSVETISRSNYSYLGLKLPAKYIEQKINKLPYAGLPNGSPLPGVPEAELPHVTVPLKNKSNVILYLGQSMMGALFESGFDPYANMTLPVTNGAGTKVVGYFSTLAAAGSHLGGFYLMTSVPEGFWGK